MEANNNINETNYNQENNYTENRGNYRGRGRGGYKKNVNFCFNFSFTIGIILIKTLITKIKNKDIRKINFNNSRQNNYVNKSYNKNHLQQQTMDPNTLNSLVYRAEMYILLKYPYLIDLNKKNEDFKTKIPENSNFFVIKSFSEEDVHKAIKYNLWSSTKTGNQTLNNAYITANEKGGETFLFFSCNGSGKFAGLAKMKGEVQGDKMFPFWTQDSKWPGILEIEWIYIKDVPFREFKNLIITMKDGDIKCVSNSRDCQEIPPKEGNAMVEVFDGYFNSNTILEHFEYYDLRQENFEKNNPVQYEVTKN